MERTSSTSGRRLHPPFLASHPGCRFHGDRIHVVALVDQHPAHLAQAFGYQTPACWLLTAALPAASILELRLAVVAVGDLAGQRRPDAARAGHQGLSEAA